ncbi:hypothetical protein RHS04_01893 [Rhizoctonia solani]|uniref:Uncharacterized protein n=1 Tax=Rhizoctonia solani TaxID=456999 RepID=A0A8H7IDI1_9AGAM|nr:hypothetical protein RHS04_01893 [Rhizoctonia solani]KAF8755862.1 hypothetical protein RHS01_04876 [Rhizoctonia solani]
MHVKSFALLAGFSLLTVGARSINGVEIEERAPAAVCTKKFSGTLSTMEMVIGEGPALGKWQNLTINSNNEIAFKNNTNKRGVQAEFQACRPNYGGFPNDGANNIWAGRIYLPELKKCLAVKNPNAADQRHYVEVRTCPKPSLTAVREGFTSVQFRRFQVLTNLPRMGELPARSRKVEVMAHLLLGAAKPNRVESQTPPGLGLKEVHPAK